MAEKQPFSLQVWPTVDKDNESLKYLISRINDQKGPFRNVTEESLEQELKDFENEIETLDHERNGEHAKEAEDTKNLRDEVYKAREEILKQVAEAYQESATALDFVSLVLSKHAPGPAALTMSPYLKERLPIGCLGAETVQAPQETESDRRDQEMIAIGWRMQSLSSAADSLLKSATRLDDEIKRETIYWDEVLSVKDEGWSLCRLPRERHTLAVRYGFAEAHADFRDRGLAALRRDGDGHLSLDRGARLGGYRRLRVRILHRGNPVGASTERLQDNEKGSVIARQILQARDSIFDEELHLEIHREARNLLNQDVRCKGSKVLVPFEKDEHFEVDLVDADQRGSEPLLGPHVAADSILIALRLLLCQAHRQNLQKRSQVPPPLKGEGTRPRPVYAILKPIMETLEKGEAPIHVLSGISKGYAQAA